MLGEKKQHFFISYARFFHCTESNEYFGNVNLYILDNYKIRIISS